MLHPLRFQSNEGRFAWATVGTPLADVVAQDIQVTVRGPGVLMLAYREAAALVIKELAPAGWKERVRMFYSPATNAPLQLCAMRLAAAPGSHHTFLMLADRGGDFALVEKTGAGMTVIRADDKPLVHTNHILDDVFAAQNPQQSEPILSNGQRRYDTAKKRAANGVSMDSILADRSPQGAICQQGEAGLYTDFALLFDAVNDRLSLWAGYPGVVAPEIIDVGALLG